MADQESLPPVEKSSHRSQQRICNFTTVLLTSISLLLLVTLVLMAALTMLNEQRRRCSPEESVEEGGGEGEQMPGRRKKILIVQPNQAIAKSHFSFTINLANVLADAGHQIHLLVPFMSEEEKLNAELEQQYQVTYFLASKQFREERAEFLKNNFGPGLNRTRRERQQQELALALPTAQLPIENGDMLTARPSPSPSAAMPPDPAMANGPPTRLSLAKVYLEIASDLDVMDRLRAQKFDIGIAEAFMGNEWALALFRLLGVPRTVVTSAMAPTPEFYYYLGMLGRIKQAKVPALRGTKLGDHRKEQREARAEEIWQNMLGNVSQMLANAVETGITFHDIAEQHYGFANFPTMPELFKQADIYLANTQPEMDFAESTNAIQASPNRNKICYVGGVNAFRARQALEEHATASPIEPEVLERVERHPGGVVLFGLGTVLHTERELSDEQVEAIQQAMSRFPDHLFIVVLSKGDPRIGRLNNNNDADSTGGNVYATDWVNQPAILAHPNAKAFISHCGMNSALEACWNGVPLVCSPWMGDQFYNAEALASRGLAVVLDLVNGFGADELAQALQRVLGGRGGNDAGAENGAESGDKPQETTICLDEMRKLGETLRQKPLIDDILNAVGGGDANGFREKRGN